MDNPFVSIITPSFNSMPYIRDNIESVLMQGYSNLEHIIIDGGSTDGTIELLKKYTHITWISEKDNGQSHALNKGFKKAKGEIIGWLNSDDSYTPGAIKSAIHYLTVNHNVDVVYTDINIIDAENKIIGLSKGDKFDLERLLTFNMVKQPSLFLRRRVIEALAGLNESLHYVMDHEFWLRAGLNGFKFKYLQDHVFANFRLVPGTKSYESATNFSKEWSKIVADKIQDPFFSRLDKLQKRSILRTVQSGVYVSQMMKSLDIKNRLDFLSAFTKAIKTKPGLITNRGMWKLLSYGLFGIKHELTSKYKSHSAKLKYFFWRT